MSGSAFRRQPCFTSAGSVAAFSPVLCFLFSSSGGCFPPLSLFFIRGSASNCLCSFRCVCAMNSAPGSIFSFFPGMPVRFQYFHHFFCFLSRKPTQPSIGTLDRFHLVLDPSSASCCPRIGKPEERKKKTKTKPTTAEGSNDSLEERKHEQRQPLSRNTRKRQNPGENYKANPRTHRNRRARTATLSFSCHLNTRAPPPPLTKRTRRPDAHTSTNTHI